MLPDEVLQKRYKLKKKLGQNAGRQTWLAVDLSTQPAEPVIVKLLAFGEQIQWDSLKLFEREVDVLKHLNHPRIPKYRDSFTIDERILWFGLVQQYIPGVSLQTLLRRGGKFSEAEVQKIAIKLLQILTYLHQLSPAVLHRDIKPSNLMLGEDNQIYLVDFGAVQAQGNIPGGTFTVVGTYGYTPMEQFGGRAVPASDLYALGATLIHLLTGIAPADLPQRNLRIDFSCVKLSRHFRHWLQTLTEPDVEHRFTTARQALSALDNSENPNCSFFATKPYGSRIKLKKSASQLEIKIPARGLLSSDAFLMLVSVLVVAIFLLLCNVIFADSISMAVIFAISSLSTLLVWTVSILGGVHIRFNRDSFCLRWQLLGLRYLKLQEKTAAIDDVFTSPASFIQNKDKPLMAVTIQAGTKELKFGAFAPQLAKVECDWLVEEIKCWLGLR